jgi:hypothetical protein
MAILRVRVIGGNLMKGSLELGWGRVKGREKRTGKSKVKGSGQECPLHTSSV